MKPDLVLTMGGGARDRVRIAERLGIQSLDLPYPQSLADIEAGIAKVAGALGRADAGRRVVAQIRQLRRTVPADRADTIWLGGGGRSVSAQGLAADWMGLAGLRQRKLQGDRVSLEHLLVSPPAILLRSDYRQGQYSGEQRWLSHPLAGGTAQSRTLAAEGRRWTCMGPTMIGEIARLRRELAR
jgi:iron complex transport system substrate-binding protein